MTDQQDTNNISSNKKSAQTTNTHINGSSTAKPSASNGSAAYASTPYSTKKSKSNWLLMLVLFIVALLMGLFAGKLWAEKKAEEGGASADAKTSAINADTEPTSQKPVLTVETTKPSNSVLSNELTAEGTINPENTASVSGKVNGVTIKQVHVKEGDRVKKGQVLAVFDTEAMQQQLTMAQSELVEAQGNLVKAQGLYQKAAPLLDIGAVSRQEVENLQANASQAQAGVVAAKARVNNQKINLNNANVTAPVSGIISDKTATIGSLPGPEPLFTIIENGKLEWQAQVDPNKVGKINVGTPVEVSLPNNKKVMGQVSRISPTTEKGSRQITIYASLANHPNAKAGMYQRGTFKLGNQSKPTIPISAVVTQDGYDYVMQVKAVKDENNKTIYRISRIKVKLGERQGDRVVLLEPLKGNSNIVRQGGSFLSDGDIVQVADIKPNKAPTNKK